MPSIDHNQSLATGGKDEETNWITTSMKRNIAKGMWSLEELDWKLHWPGRVTDWDGGSAMLIKLCDMHKDSIQKNKYVQKWLRVTRKQL